MQEEQVTKAILKWLMDQNWEIVCFDFPQSGTGRFLHPNQDSTHKNRDSINPDIVAVKGNVCVFFENKNRFYLSDYKKINGLIVHNDYSEAISVLLSKYTITNIYYGIGLPAAKHNSSSVEASHLVDFIVGVSEAKTVSVLYHSCPNIFHL